MALPKLVTPEFDTIIPSTKEYIKFRPFLVKEEKVLYMALESGEQKDIFNATMNILEACIQTPGIDVEKLTTYDTEFLFLQLRAKSVNEVATVNIKHELCETYTPVDVRLDEINIEYPENHEHKIDLTDKIGIALKDPSAKIVSKINGTNELDNFFYMIYHCTDYIYDSEKLYEEFTREEFRDFIESLSKAQFEKIKNFFDTLPKLKKELTFTCHKCGVDSDVTLEGLQTFFT